MFKNLGALGDISKLMKQAQEMQAKAQEIQDELDRLEVSGQSGAGLVTAVSNGKGALVRVSIDPSLIADGEAEVLEDLIVAAVNDAQTKAAETAQERMAEATAGLPIPPGFKFG